MIAPIQTTYRGYKMRSRTEAKWAVFFDALGIRWEYEKEGYDLGAAGWYLPDFWLPDEQCFVEVKGAELSAEDKAKAKALALGTRKPVRVVIGIPDYDPESDRLDIHYRIKGVEYRFETLAYVGIDAEILAMMREDPDEYGGRDHIEAMARDGGVVAGYGYYDPFEWFPCSTAQYIAAFEAARSARFEHGEQPSTITPMRQSVPVPPGVPLLDTRPGAPATHTISSLRRTILYDDVMGVIAGKLASIAILPEEQQGTVLRATLTDSTGIARLKVGAAVYAATRPLWTAGQRVLLSGRMIFHDGDFAGVWIFDGDGVWKTKHTILEVLRVQELPA